MHFFFWKIWQNCMFSPGGSAPSPTGNPGSAPAKSHIYCPQRSWGKVIFSQASVILFTAGGGLPQCRLEYHPPTRQSPRPGTPQDQAGTPCLWWPYFYFYRAGGSAPLDLLLDFTVTILPIVYINARSSVADPGCWGGYAPPGPVKIRWLPKAAT